MERLLTVSQAVAAAPRGGKAAVYASACADLGCSLPTLHRWLKDVRVAPERKRRSDAGALALSRDDALVISGIMLESQRKNAKRLLSVGQAVEIARANGAVIAARMDADTGEWMPLSDSAVARALRAHGLHPDQLNRPAPATELQSLHPNHVWQIDASLCVLYYLNARTQQEGGLQVMPRDQFYKNKPANLKRIEADRVWSYEVTDHYSGAIFVHYVMGAESATNLAESFIAAICQRPGDPFHGVPRILMMDMGSANTSGMFTNLARRLQVQVLAHAPGNARATGQVEKARDLIERGFESALRFRPVADLADLNTQAARWATWFNSHRVHTRHGKTRYDCWMGITSDQLRIAPPAELCQELLTHTPEERKVSVTLSVQFKGAEYDVRAVPGVMVGEKVQVTYNPWAPQGSAIVIERGADGAEVLHTVPLIERTEAGFRTDAAVIGEQWARPADTVLQTNRKEVERLVMDAPTDAAAEAARKAKALPFGGRIDPYKPIEQAPEKTWLPRRGEQLQPTVQTTRPEATPRLLTHFEATRELSAAGVAMNKERVNQLRAWHPEGVPENELANLQHRLTVRAGLRVVGVAANE